MKSVTCITGVSLAAALLLAGCTTAEPAGPHTTGPSKAASSALPTPGETAATGEQPVAAPAIVDDVLQNTIQPTAIVRNFSAPSAPTSGSEVVLVKVDAVAGGVYYGGISDTDFRLATGPDDEYPATAKTSVVAEAMTAAGYTPLGGLASTQSGTGWVAFILTDPAQDLELQYKRLAYKGSDGADIPEQVFTSPLTPE